MLLQRSEMLLPALPSTAVS